LFTLLLLFLAPIAVLLIAYFVATQLPRFCGYLLGPTLLLSAAIFFVTFREDLIRSSSQSDAWPGNFLPLIVGYAGVVWCLVGIVFMARGLEVVRYLDEPLARDRRAPEKSSQTSQLAHFSVPASKRTTPMKMVLVAVAIYVVACLAFVLVSGLIT
jgi:hypothetical protein